MRGFKRCVVIVFALLAKGLFLLKVSELLDLNYGLIFADNEKTINFVKVNDNQTELVSKLLSTNSEIFALDYSHITDLIVWCEKDAIKYAELNRPYEQNTLIDDRCNSISYDWYNDMIYFYSLTSKQIIAIKRFSEYTRTKNKNYIYSLITRINVTSLKCDPFRSQLFWIEQNRNNNAHQLMQLSLSRDQNQLMPRAVILDDGSPKLFDVNFEYQKLYVITQNDHLVEVNYNEYDIPAKDIMPSTKHFGDASSITHCKRYLYFQDVSQNSIVAYYVEETTENLLEMADWNKTKNIVSIKCIRERSTHRSSYEESVNINQNNDAKDSDQINISSTPVCPVLTNSSQDNRQGIDIKIGIIILIFVSLIAFIVGYKTNKKLSKQEVSYGKLAEIMYSSKSENETIP